MSHLIFDIETIGEEFDVMDHTTQEVLTRWIRNTAENDAAYQEALKELKNGMGFSPLTGEIVAIGVMDSETEKGAVYFQAPDVQIEEFSIGNVKLKPMTEKDMLEQFWNLAKKYEGFVSFNGRCFDAPFMAVRSAIHHIRPSKDLMNNRYLNSQRGCKHIDLFDQLCFYGATRHKGSLHLWCRAFGIKSPKSDGVSGDNVAALFKEKKYAEIAKYNVGDLYATMELHKYWEKYMKF